MSLQKVVLLSCGSFNPPTIMHLRIFELARDQLQRSGRFQVVGGVISPTHDGYGKKDLASADHRIKMASLALANNSWVKLSTWEAKQPSWTRTRSVIEYHQRLTASYLNTRRNAADLKDINIKVSPVSVSKIINNIGKANEIDFKIPCKNRLDNYVNTLEPPADVKDDWIPDSLSKSDHGLVKCKLLCGADLLESFNVPNLWSTEDMITLTRDYGLVVISREGSDPYKSIYASDILHENQGNIELVREWLSNEISSTRIRQAIRRHESILYMVPDLVVDYVRKEKLYIASNPCSSTSST